MNKLLVTYDKKLITMHDMGGFPDERIVVDKTKIVVLDIQPKDEPTYMVNYKPIAGMEVLIHPELTEKQVDKAIIEFLHKKIQTEETHKLYLNTDIMR